MRRKENSPRKAFLAKTVSLFMYWYGAKDVTLENRQNTRDTVQISPRNESKISRQRRKGKIQVWFALYVCKSDLKYLSLCFNQK